jgi:hypothetical protein
MLRDDTQDQCLMEEQPYSYRLNFKVNCCEIQLADKITKKKSDDSQKLSLCLAYTVLPDESTWFTSSIDNVDYIAIVFSKTPPTTVFPGCEWWNQVFEEDEKIDTLTCSVGADTSQLPQHAQDRAAQEHARFQSLSAREQEEELEGIGRYKQVRQ